MNSTTINFILTNQNIDIMTFLKDFERYARLYNLDKYPQPNYVNHSSIIKNPKVKMNWRNIEKYAMTDEDILKNENENGIVRVKKQTVLASNKKPYNSKLHEGKDTIETLLYAIEDFYIIAEKEAYETSHKEIIKKEDVFTTKGKLMFVRDFTKDNPTKNEVDLLAQSYGSFISFCAKQEIRKRLEKEDPDLAKKLNEILDKIMI